MENLIFEKGEVRKIEYSVCSSPSNESLVITQASWKLIGPNGEVVESGTCDVKERKISMLIAFQVSGSFTLEVTTTIPPETIIDRMLVKVVN